MKEEAFFQKLLGTFRIEAEEHINSLSNGFIALESALSPERRSQEIERVFREAHNLKGAARAVSQRSVERICQELENVLADWKLGKIQPLAKDFTTLYATIDAIELAIFRSPEEETLLKIIKGLEAIRTHSSPSFSFQSEKNQAVETSEKLTLKNGNEWETTTIRNKNESIFSRGTEKTSVEATIRVSLSKIDHLFQHAEEMLPIKLISQEHLSDLKRLYVKKNEQEKELANLLYELQLLQRMQQFAPDIQSMAGLKRADPLNHDEYSLFPLDKERYEGNTSVIQQESGIERELPQSMYSTEITFYYEKALEKVLFLLSKQQKSNRLFKEKLGILIKKSEQNHHYVGSLVDNLLDRSKTLLMQPINTLFESIPRMIRDTAHDLKKEVYLDIQGGDIELDRRILEGIKDPLIHLVRNAIDHGIESPSERKQANKPPAGNIKIVASQGSGNHIEIAVIDDGRGMDIQKIKRKAIQQGLLSEKEGDELSEEETMKFALHAGISTRDTVTELSGRGLGLGIILEKVNQLRGQVTIESKKSQGTQLTLILPLTLAVFRGIHITVVGQDFIIPIHNVKRVVPLKREHIQREENQEAIYLNNTTVLYIHLADLLGLKRIKTPESLYALIVSVAEKTIAFGADDVLYEEDVLVKRLGKQCVRVKNIMGATIMEEGHVIPILNPLDLIKSALKAKSHTSALRNKD